MILREEIDLPQSTHEVWKIVRDPGNMPAWNPKCVEAESPQRMQEGEEFLAVFQMSGHKAGDGPLDGLKKLLTA